MARSRSSRLEPLFCTHFVSRWRCVAQLPSVACITLHYEYEHNPAYLASVAEYDHIRASMTSAGTRLCKRQPVPLALNEC